MTVRDVSEHVKQRLDRQAIRIAELEVELAACKPADRLVVEVARVVAHAVEWGEPGPPSSVLGEGGRGKPSSRPPASSGDRRVWHAFRLFSEDVLSAVGRYEQRAEGEYQQVRVHVPRKDKDGRLTSIPSVPCAGDRCRKNIKLFTLDERLRQVWTLECPRCGAPVANAFVVSDDPDDGRIVL